MGDTRTENVTHNEDINVIAIFFREKSEILMQIETEKNKELPTSKPHFDPPLGRG